MTTEQLFSNIEKKISEYVENYRLTPESVDKNKGYKSFIENIFKNEDDASKPYITWLFEKYEKNTSILIYQIKILVFLKYSFDKTIGSESILEYLCGQDNAIEKIKLLLEYSNSNLIPKKYRIHPIAAARIKKNANLEIFLIEHFQKYDRSGETLLTLAIEKNYEFLFEYVLSNKPELLNQVNMQKEYPIFLAITCGRYKWFIKMLSKGADVFVKNGNSDSIAHLWSYLPQDVANDIQKQYPAMFEKIKPLFAHLENHNCWKLLPIHYAMDRLNISFFEFLLNENPLLLDVKSNDSNLLFYALFCKDDKSNFIELIEKKAGNRLWKEISFHQWLRIFQMQSQNIPLMDFFASKEFMEHNLGFQENSDQQFIWQLTVANFMDKLDVIENIIGSFNNWQNLPEESILQLVEKWVSAGKVDYFIKYDLFNKNPSFLYSKINGSFVNLVQLMFKHIRKSPMNAYVFKPLMKYILEYLEQKKSDYPFWLGNLVLIDESLFKLISDVNMFVYDDPLFHFLEHYYFYVNVIRLSEEKKATTSQYQYFSGEISEDKNYAFYKNQMELLLLNYPINVNAKDKDGQHLFAKLIQKGVLGFDRIRFLMDSPFSSHLNFSLLDLDKNHSSILHLACEYGYFDLMRWCIDVHHLSPTLVRLTDTKTPIEICFEQQKLLFVKYLVNKIKPHQWLEWITHLVENKQEWLIEHLVQYSFYKNTLKQSTIDNILKLGHPLLSVFFDQKKSKKFESISTIDEDDLVFEYPSTQNDEKINHLETNAIPQEDVKASLQEELTPENLSLEIILEWIDNQQTSKIRRLKHPIYAEAIRHILEPLLSFFIQKLHFAKSSTLIQQFLRIPIVKEILKTLTTEDWKLLIQQVIDNNNERCFFWLLMQPNAAEIIQDQLYVTLVQLRENKLFSWISMMLSNMNISQEKMYAFLLNIISLKDVDLLNLFLSITESENYLMNLNEEIIYKMKESSEEICEVLLMLPQLSKITHLEQNTLFRFAFTHDWLNVCELLLQSEEVQKGLLTDSSDLLEYCVIEKRLNVLELMSQYPILVDYLQSVVGYSDLEIDDIHHDNTSSHDIIESQESNLNDHFIQVVPVHYVQPVDLTTAIMWRDCTNFYNMYMQFGQLHPQTIKQLFVTAISCGQLPIIDFLISMNKPLLEIHPKFINFIVCLSIRTYQPEIAFHLFNYFDFNQQLKIFNLRFFRIILKYGYLDWAYALLNNPDVQKFAHIKNNHALKLAIEFQQPLLCYKILSLPKVMSTLKNKKFDLFHRVIKTENLTLIFQFLVFNDIFYYALTERCISLSVKESFIDFYIETSASKIELNDNDWRMLDFIVDLNLNDRLILI